MGDTTADALGIPRPTLVQKLRLDAMLEAWEVSARVATRLHADRPFRFASEALHHAIMVKMGGMGGAPFEVPAGVRRPLVSQTAARPPDRRRSAMVQIDIPVAFGTASLFAAAVEQGLRSERRRYFYQRALAASLIFQLLLVVWLPVYLLIAHFGFQTSHMWWKGDSITDYPWLLPAFLTAYFVACIGGFHVGSLLVRQGRTRAVWMLFIGGFAFFGAWMAFQPYRTLTLGSYGEWQARTAPVGLDGARFRRLADGRDGGVLRRAADRLQGAAAGGGGR